MGVVRVQALEAVALQRVVFDVAATAFLLPIFLWPPRLRRQRGKAPVLRKRGEHVVDIGIVKARADDAGLEIVRTDDRGDAAEIAKRPLMQSEKRGELLIPDGLFVAVPRMAQREAKDPRALPLARRGLERRRAPKKIGLAFLPGLTFEDPDRAPAWRHRPQVSLDG